jgi:hypothetical protein
MTLLFCIGSGRRLTRQTGGVFRQANAIMIDQGP